MTLSIIDVVEYLYPGQISKGNVSFRQPKTDILIALWLIQKVPQPSEQELIDYGIAHERDIEINNVKNNCLVLVQNVVDDTAQGKTYANGISCVSYANSSNAIWKTEALAFIKWRDAVWGYLYNLLATIGSGTDPVPSVDEIIAGIVPINWPE